MKKIILSLILSFSFATLFAQSYNQNLSSYAYLIKRGTFDSTLILPYHDTTINSTLYRPGVVVFNIAHEMCVWNGNYWDVFKPFGGGGDTTDLSSYWDSSQVKNYVTVWVNRQGFLKTEVEPIFTTSVAYNITAQDTLHWDSAYVRSTFNDSTYKLYFFSADGRTDSMQLKVAPFDTTNIYTEINSKQDTGNYAKGNNTISVTAGSSAISIGGGTQPLSSNPNFIVTPNNTMPLWNAVQLQGLPILNTAPSAGQVLFFNGTSWVPYSLNPGSGTVTSVGLNAAYGTVVTSNTTNPVTSVGTFTVSVDTTKIPNFRYTDSALAGKKNLSDSTAITGYSTIGGMNDTLNKINGINGWLYNPATKTGQVDSTKYSTVRATHDSIVANIPNLSIYTKYTDTSSMLLPYTKKGSNISQFNNDLGYLTSIPNLPLPTSYLSANGDTVVSSSDTGWDQRLRENGNIVQYKGKYWVFYNGYRMPYTDSTAYCGVAYSNDGVHWTKGGPYGTGRITWYPSEDPYCIIVNDTAYLYTENKGVPAGKHNIILFKSTDMINFTYSGVAFDLPSDTSSWDSYDVSSPLVTFDTSSHKYYLFYEGIKHTSGITGNASVGVAYSTNPDTFYRFLDTPVIVPGVTLKWSNNQAVPDDIIYQNGTWYFIGHTQYGNPVISDPYVPFVCSSVDLIHWQDYLGGTIQRNSDQFSDFGDGVMIFNHAGSRSAMYMSNDGDTTLILGNFTNPGFRNDNISMLDYQMTGNVGFYNNGYLIITNIDTSMIGNWVLKMEGNSYNSLTPLNAEIQFSNKSGVNGFSRVGATSTMYNINANLFYYEGKICFWTDGGVLSNQFQYLRFSISGSGVLTRIDSVLNAPLPVNILYSTPLSFYNSYYTYRIGSDNSSYYTQFNQADGGTGDLFNINSLNQSIFGFNYSNGTFTSYIPYISGYYGLALNTGSTSFNQANIRLFINSLGNVGIGTINPSYKLDVNGNARINLTPPGSAGIDSILVKSASGEISAISPFYYSTPSATHDSLAQNALDVLFPLSLNATNKTLSADTTMKDSSLVNYRQMKQYVSTNAYIINNINVATVGTIQLLSVPVGSTAFILTKIEIIQTSSTGTNPTINIGYTSPNYSNFFSGTFGMVGQYNTAIPTLSGDLGIPGGNTLYLNITTAGTGAIAVLIEGFYL